jgi:hypothetical protein
MRIPTEEIVTDKPDDMPASVETSKTVTNGFATHRGVAAKL